MRVQEQAAKLVDRKVPLVPLVPENSVVSPNADLGWCCRVYMRLCMGFRPSAACTE